MHRRKTMEKIKSDIIIIGAGLTGLCLAYYLRKRNKKVIVLEARDRLGGRIYTRREKDQAPVEMGATWIHGHHRESLNLLADLGLSVFKQDFGSRAIYEADPGSPAQLVDIPPSDNPSYRVMGGSDQLIDGLSSNVGSAEIIMGEKIASISLREEGIVASSDTCDYEAKWIVSSLPPHLFVNKIVVTPTLPDSLLHVADRTRTWMGESIKIALRYRERFWKDKDWSGMIFSNAGPILEMYDHSDQAGTQFALMGFMNGTYHALSEEERCELVVGQLEKYYGPQVKSFLAYEESVWSKEAETSIAMKDLLEPQGNFGHSVYQKEYLGGRLFLAGTETSKREAGYMEGAILSAQHIFAKLDKMD